MYKSPKLCCFGLFLSLHQNFSCILPAKGNYGATDAVCRKSACVTFLQAMHKGSFNQPHVGKPIRKRTAHAQAADPCAFALLKHGKRAYCFFHALLLSEDDGGISGWAAIQRTAHPIPHSQYMPHEEKRYCACPMR